MIPDSYIFLARSHCLLSTLLKYLLLMFLIILYTVKYRMWVRLSGPSVNQEGSHNKNEVSRSSPKKKKEKRMKAVPGKKRKDMKIIFPLMELKAFLLLNFMS